MGCLPHLGEVEAEDIIEHIVAAGGERHKLEALGVQHRLLGIAVDLRASQPPHRTRAYDDLARHEDDDAAVLRRLRIDLGRAVLQRAELGATVGEEEVLEATGNVLRALIRVVLDRQPRGRLLRTSGSRNPLCCAVRRATPEPAGWCQTGCSSA